MTSVTIIGGYGGMGRLFATVLKENGFSVTITGPREKKGKKTAKELGVSFEASNSIAARDADMVIIAVPIIKTLDVIREVAPKMKEGSLLMDLTSVKEDPCTQMEELAGEAVAVVGCHPIFGPMIDSFEDQNFVFCPLRENRFFKEFKEMLKKEGARICECSPKEHDEAMGVVQGMTHFMLISAGAAMRKLDFDVSSSEKFSSPVYQLLMDLIGRILGQDPRLYAEIQLENKRTKEVRKAYLASAKDLDDILSKGDEEAFVKRMDSAKKHFGDTEKSLKRTQEVLKK